MSFTSLLNINLIYINSVNAENILDIRFFFQASNIKYQYDIFPSVAFCTTPGGTEVDLHTTGHR